MPEEINVKDKLKFLQIENIESKWVQRVNQIRILENSVGLFATLSEIGTLEGDVRVCCIVSYIYGDGNLRHIRV